MFLPGGHMGPPLRYINKFIHIIRIVCLYERNHVSSGGGMSRFLFVADKFAPFPPGGDFYCSQVYKIGVISTIIRGYPYFIAKEQET